MRPRLRQRLAVLAALVVGVAGSVVTGVATAPPAVASNNGLSIRPAMGWSSWSFVRRWPDETKIKAQADAMVSSGLAGHGYVYINLDDFWQLCDGNGFVVDSFGRWVADPAKFPNGIKAVADYVHGRGLKFGFYVTPGIPKNAVLHNTPIEGTSFHAADIANTALLEKNYNCKNMYFIYYCKPGAQAYVDSWARQFASWGVDYLKIDGVGSSDIPDVEAWAGALRRSGRPINYALSNNLPISDAATWQRLANSWRTQGDVECYCGPGPNGSGYPLTTWSRVTTRFASASAWQPWAGPEGWNDLDSLEIGNGDQVGLTADQRRSTMTLWAMAGAPLLLGTDLTNLTSTDLAMLTNDRLIGVDQDGYAAARIVDSGANQVWRKREDNGDFIVALFNTDTSASSTVSVTWSQVGFSGSAAVTDLWSGADVGTISNSYSATLRPGETRLIRARPTSGAIVRYQAENATVTPGTVDANHIGFTVNGSAVGSGLAFDGTGSWDTWAVTTATVNLTAGSNTIRVTATTTGGAPNLDYLEVERQQSTTRYEAENAVCQGTIDSDHTGFSGTGFCNTTNAVGASVEWTVNVVSAGTATLTFRYANGTTASRPMTLTVNGTSAGTLDFPGTGSWDTWANATVTAPVNAGSNTIRVTATTSAGGPNLDYLDVAAAKPAGTRYEAENAVCQGTIDSDHTGFSGTGFCNTTNALGASVEWTVNAASAGTATLTFRYANGSTTSRPMTLTVNGAAAGTLDFPGTGSWDTWANATVTAPVNAGSNTIRVTATTSAGGPNLDYLDVNVAPPTTTTRYEAENAVCQGTVDSDHTGFSGTGFCNTTNAVGASVEWTVDTASAGTATLTFRYANGSTTSRPMTLTVNGAAAGTLDFPGTGSWDTWANATVTAPVNAGSNTIRVTATTSAGGPNLDYLDVNVAPPTTTTRYEAENAVCQGTVDSDHTGFSGTGFCNTTNAVGASVEWTVNAASAGTATLT